jgi:hypothetical protein
MMTAVQEEKKFTIPPLEEAEMRLNSQISCLTAIIHFMGTDARPHEPELEDVQVFFEKLKEQLEKIVELFHKGN